MIRGGIAGKGGNRYEAKWAVRQFLDVIADNAQNLKFESVDEELRGFEFKVTRKNLNEYHQTKINAPNGNWTINALQKEGVLEAFSRRLSENENSCCYFVSQDNAKDFRTLTENARRANSEGEYSEKISEDHKKKFFQLVRIWAQPADIAFNWLRRIFVEFIPERRLDSEIETLGGLFFQWGGKAVFPILREILEQNFNKSLTVDGARQAIKEHGSLQFKEWAFDPTIAQRLKDETDAYLETYSPFGFGGQTISRNETKVLVEELCNENGPGLIILTGIAGSGKSGVVRGAIERLKSLRIPHLAFRVDQHLPCATNVELGKRLTGRDESPVITLKRSYPNETSVLLIDQVDAVSEVSGRNGQLRNVVFRLIKEAQFFGTLKIVLVCRRFDLENDPRLRELKYKEKTKHVDVPLLDWKEVVEPILKKRDFKLSFFKEPQRNLLKVPINLAVFLEINEQECQFSSLTELHSKLLEKKERLIRRERNPSWTIIEALGVISSWMSKRQMLTAPDAVLDSFPGAITVLSSEGLVLCNRGQVSFFHESFFDYVFARSFLRQDLSLLDLLLPQEQHLFRRTQVRQILESLRNQDFSRYLKELSAILIFRKVRFHLKVAICQWLGTIEDPKDQEYGIISRFDKPGESFHPLFGFAALSTPTWFDLLNKKNWIRQQLFNGQEMRVRRLLWWLAVAAEKWADETIELLRSWWGGNPSRGAQLLKWIGLLKPTQPEKNLLQFNLDLIQAHPNELFNGLEPYGLEIMLQIWEKVPECHGKVLHSIFEAWFRLNPDTNLFDGNRLKAMETHPFRKLMGTDPIAFLHATTHALTRSIDQVVAEGEDGENWSRFYDRTYKGYRFGFDEFLDLYRSALKSVARESPDVANVFLDKLDYRKHTSLMHLHLEAIQANPAVLGQKLTELISCPNIFDSGWDGTPWYSFAMACRESFPHLGLSEKAYIEKAVLDFAPEIKCCRKALKKLNLDGEYAPWTRKEIIHYLKCSGRTQRYILETIGEPALSSRAQTRLHELRWKFPKPPPKPDVYGFRPHRPEISLEQAERMKEKNWLTLIKRFAEINEIPYSVTSNLHELSKNKPKWFSDLTLKIPTTVHPEYVKSILRGLADAEEPHSESLIRVVKHAHLHPKRPFGREIGWLLEKHPKIADNEETLQILIWYALNGEAEEPEDLTELRKELETVSVDQLFQPGQRIHLRSHYSPRAQAWVTLGSILWEVPELENRAWEALEVALEKEPLISVRCSVIKTLMPLFNMNKDLFSAAMRKLVQIPKVHSKEYQPLRLSPLFTFHGIKLFEHIYIQLPDLADELTHKLLECGDETIELIGAWLVFLHSFRNKKYIPKADQLRNRSVDHRRAMAGLASEAIFTEENRHRAEDILKELFSDEDEEVRKIASRTFGRMEATDIISFQEIASIFIISSAFKSNKRAIFDVLERATCDVVELVLHAGEQLASDLEAKGTQHGWNPYDCQSFQELLKRAYLASEADEEAQEKILDLIDLMLANEIQSGDRLFSDHDRW